MKPISAAVLSLLILSFGPATLSAKGTTVRIIVRGADPPTPLDIADPKIAEFGIWQGPGTFINGVEGTEGFIIDWPKGIVADLPARLLHYEVVFFTGCQPNQSGCRTNELSIDYIVFYDYDPATEHGFVYLPGKDDARFRYNQAMWHGHGLEGHWLRASNAWESFVRPLIAKARALPEVRR